MSILAGVTAAAVIQMRHTNLHRELVYTAEHVRSAIYTARSLALAPPADKTPRTVGFEVRFTTDATGLNRVITEESVQATGATGGPDQRTSGRVLSEYVVPSRFRLLTPRPDTSLMFDIPAQGQATAIGAQDGRFGLVLASVEDPSQRIELTTYLLTGQVVVCDSQNQGSLCGQVGQP